MTAAVTSPGTPRVDAITDLLRSVENLVVEYATLAENERAGRLDEDADRITGEIGRQLHVARVRLARSLRPRG